MPHVEVGGIRYAYIEAGAGPLVLFAHGTFGAKETFAPQIALLSDHYRCISIDLPGHGGSSYDPQGWGIDDLVRAVPALIAVLGEERATLIGVSQGGAIFMRAALAFPDSVFALVIICAGAGTPPPQLMQRLRDFASILSDEDDEGARRRSASDFLAGFHAPDFPAAEPREFAAEVTRALGHPRSAMPLVADVPATYTDVQDRLVEITCPTLVVWGDSDFRPSLGGELAAQIPGARLRVIRDAGHHANVDAPKETGLALKDFLDGLSLADGGDTRGQPS